MDFKHRFKGLFLRSHLPSSLHSISLAEQHTHSLTHTHILTQTHRLTHTHSHTLIDSHTHTHTHIHTHTHAHTHTHTHTDAHTHTCTLIHTLTHTHTPKVQWLASFSSLSALKQTPLHPLRKTQVSQMSAS